MGARWIVYDWFKLIVLLILIALLLAVRGCSGQADLLPTAATGGLAQTDASSEASATAATADSKASADAAATKAAADAAASEAKASADAAATKAAADVAAAKATADAAAALADASNSASSEGAANSASGTGTEGDASAPAADGAQDGAQSAGGATAAELSAACDMAMPVRLSGTGMRARVINATLTLRSSPEVANNVLGFMPVGSEVDVSALPVCTPYLTGANNWWKVETAAGTVGYAAEGSAVSPVYYLEEIK